MTLSKLTTLASSSTLAAPLTASMCGRPKVGLDFSCPAESAPVSAARTNTAAPRNACQRHRFMAILLDHTALSPNGHATRLGTIQDFLDGVSHEVADVHHLHVARLADAVEFIIDAAAVALHCNVLDFAQVVKAD